MFENLSTAERSIAIQRLTALWALNECGLGGILHAFQSPFTGLIVGSIAMICIGFICSLAENKWGAVVTALLTVLIIKGLVSPHTSPTAYFAVSFQALTGAVLYRWIPNALIASVLFVSIGLIESAIQRLLTLTILYGNSLWEAIDLWGEWVTKQWGIILPFDSSSLVIYAYLLVHLLAGILIGWMLWKWLLTVEMQWGSSQHRLMLTKKDRKSFIIDGNRKGKKKKYVLMIFLLILIVSAYFLNIEENGLQKGLVAAIRTFMILILWFLIVAPLMTKFIQRLLKRKKHLLADRIAHTLDVMPHILWILDKSLMETKQLSFFKRWKSFILYSLLYILQFRYADDSDLNRADEKP